MKKMIFMLIILFTSCHKDDCGCGKIISSYQDGNQWTIIWIDECSGDENIREFMLDMSNWKIGDRVCELQFINTKR